MAKVTKKLVIPKNPALAADLWFKLRAQRLEAEKPIKVLKDQEGEVKKYLIDTIPKSDMTGVAGKLVSVRVEAEPYPIIEDWDELCKWVVKNKAFHIFSRSLNREAVLEFWEAGKKIGGVVRGNNPVLRYNSIKQS